MRIDDEEVAQDLVDDFESLRRQMIDVFELILEELREEEATVEALEQLRDVDQRYRSIGNRYHDVVDDALNQLELSFGGDD